MTNNPCLLPSVLYTCIIHNVLLFHHLEPYTQHMAHNIFRARTIMVGQNGPMAALSRLDGMMRGEGLTDSIKRKRFNEKPTVKRHRIRYEQALKKYNANLTAKTDMLMKASRDQCPWT